ncbi:TPA: NACHT domain-containing protein [Aeromonas veronii]
MSFAEDELFENEVRRIARARWPEAQYAGAAKVNGRERDGVFETEEVIHFLEVTTSRREDKAKEDTKKLFQLISTHQKSGSIKGAIGWFITKDEPTADQREVVKTYGKNQVKAVSLAQFQQAIIDVHSYFEKRDNHLFGSVADPNTGEINYQGEYIQLDLFPVNNDESISLQSIIDGLETGDSYVLLGDYGAGKSMTLREIYFKLRAKYRIGETAKFPIYINLREHSGQDDPSELLERHGRKIGFERPSSLIAAWRAGFAILLIDGFDEITSLGISSIKTKLREARRRSLEAVRKMLEQTPSSVGYIVSGREHFFSTPEERKSALSIREKSQTIILGELNKKQVARYIQKIVGDKIAVPDWLPTRPLLISYLATRGILQQSQDIISSIDSIDGWNILLDKIFEREARISPSLDGPTLRLILERLATMARSTQDGLGPLTQEQIRSAYVQICESEPDDQANLLLQRLPGLGIYRHEDETRTFIDIELAGVCRARDIFSFVENPYGEIQNDGWLSSMRTVNEFAGKTAIVRASRYIKQQLTSTNIESAFQSIKDKTELDILKSDLAILCAEHPLAPKQKMLIENAVFENFNFSPTEQDADLSLITFKDCIFEWLEIGDKCQSENLPYFSACLIMFVSDRTCIDDLPASKFDSTCVIEKFSQSVNTQSSILNSSLSRGEKLALSILRKVFIQSLSGRSETALVRGLDLNDRALVSDAIKLLQQNGLLDLYSRGDGNVWIPVRKELNRVRRILSSPSTCGDKVLDDAKMLIK